MFNVLFCGPEYHDDCCIQTWLVFKPVGWWVTWYSMVPVFWEIVNFSCPSACCLWFWCYQNAAFSFHSWSVLTFCYCAVAVFLPSDILVGLLCSLFCSIFLKWKDINSRMPIYQWYNDDFWFYSLPFFINPNSFLFWPLLIVDRTCDMWMTLVLPEQHNKLEAHCIFVVGVMLPLCGLPCFY